MTPAERRIIDMLMDVASDTRQPSFLRAMARDKLRACTRRSHNKTVHNVVRPHIVWREQDGRVSA
jgi:hypothetical protein